MKYASVTEVVRRIKDDLQSDYRLQSIAMEGSIIGLKRASNGHYYMNLHDETCSIRAILFRSRVGHSMDGVREGDQVVVIGAVNVYEKGGTVSFIIEKLFTRGVGTLQQQYEKIKKELYEKGYFAPEHKKSIPRFPWTVGVLTSATGAVLHDIHKIAAERNPYVEIRLFPVPVQGTGAETVIARTLEKAGRDPSLDVLILARGGGSMEDLWCFNSPQVVQAIYDAQVPVITAIGHETDTTLADYAADVRAATPTHAAELAFPDFEEIQMDLAAMADQAYQSVIQRLDRLERELGRTVAALQTRRYDDFLTMKDESVSQLVRLARQHLDLKLTRETGRLQALKASLSAMNPALLVRKGYGQLEQDGHVLTDMKLLRQERPLTIQLMEGTILTEIKEVTIHGSDKRKTKKL